MSTGEQVDEIAMPRPAHWGFWATLLWGVGIALIFTLAQSIAVIVAVVLRTANLAEPDFAQQLAAIEKDGTVLSIATYCSTIICCGAIAVAVAAKNGATLRDYLCLNPVSIRAAVLWIGGLVVLLVLLDLLTGALNKPIVPDFVATVYKSANPVWTIWIATVIAAPLFEETFFRGFLFKGFEATIMGPAWRGYRDVRAVGGHSPAIRPLRHRDHFLPGPDFRRGAGVHQVALPAAGDACGDQSDRHGRGRRVGVIA